ncbi:MAG: hypothetical protein ACRDQX_12835 [Pseudonocardiaceae bacterium]
MADVEDFEAGDKVTVTRAGWTAPGEVVRTDKDSVYVQYDGSFVEDQLDPSEVRPR